jgi:predicted house-cleaning NTP pyrophosphatase (Maf/HAM1 superfamily)
LQQGFIDGKTSLDRLQAEQARLTTLNSSITALETKRSELHDAFQKASASETRQELLEKAKVTAIEAEKFYNEYLDLRNEFGGKVAEYTEKTFEKMKAWRNKQTDFKGIEKEIELTVQELGVGSETYRTATAVHINPTPLEYEYAVNVAINFLTAKLDESARAKRRTEFEATRAETQAAQKAEQQKAAADYARQLEADKSQIVQYRIDSKLPAYTANELDDAVSNRQMRKADARLRGATV